jgi:hypothetical protein
MSCHFLSAHLPAWRDDNDENYTCQQGANFLVTTRMKFSGPEIDVQQKSETLMPRRKSGSSGLRDLAYTSYWWHDSGNTSSYVKILGDGVA